MAVEIAERIGARMRERREELGLTQAEVARRIEGKTTSDQVSRWERGKHQPNDLGPIARVLEVDVSYFYAPRPETDETPDLFGGSDENRNDQLDSIESMLFDLCVHFGLRQHDEVDAHTVAALRRLGEATPSSPADAPAPTAPRDRSRRQAGR
jgi:transcriptional regulator with XRE-family HTH domain